MIESARKNVTWWAVPLAAVVAGTAFLIAYWLLAPMMLDVKPNLLLRYFASIPLGDEVLIEDTSGNILVGLFVHYALSLLFTLVIAVVVHRWGMLVGLIGGMILGLAFYLINFYTMTLLFEWMFAIHSSALLIAHVVFGVVAGGIYEFFDDYDRPFLAEEQTA